MKRANGKIQKKELARKEVTSPLVDQSGLGDGGGGIVLVAVVAEGETLLLTPLPESTTSLFHELVVSWK